MLKVCHCKTNRLPMAILFLIKKNNNMSVADNDDSFLYKNIQENKALNLENDLESKSAKDFFRFSAISIGSFPIVLF